MSESTIKVYNRQAKDYESKWKKYLAHTHEAFLKRIETEPQDNLLDVSGGSGLLARQLIDREYPFDHFVVNDPADEMLAVARDRLSDSKISFTNNKAEELPYDEEHFDRIFCLNSFHFYQKQQQVLNRFHRILKPGGKLYLLDWNRSGFFTVVNRVIRWSSNEFIDTRSLAELLRMIRKSGFVLQDSESWSWRYWKFLFIEAEKS